MKERGNSKTRKSGCYVCKHSKLETLHGRQETRCLLDNMLVMRPSKGCTELKIMTNGDRIRRMTDEEMAKWLDDVAGCAVCAVYEGNNEFHCSHKFDCLHNIKKWIEQEVREDATD